MCVVPQGEGMPWHGPAELSPPQSHRTYSYISLSFYNHNIWNKPRTVPLTQATQAFLQTHPVILREHSIVPLKADTVILRRCTEVSLRGTSTVTMRDPVTVPRERLKHRSLNVFPIDLG